MNRARALALLSSCLKGRTPSDAVWTEILALANQTFVTSELAATLRGSSLPDDVQTFLDELYRRNSARNESLYGTLCDAVRALNAAGIELILLKGCAMWANGGGAITPSGDRIISDIDLLVRPEEGRAAVAALQSAGFDVAEDHEADDDHVMAILRRARDARTIDLHCRTPCPVGIPTLDDLHSHSEPVVVGSGRALIPRPELQVLISALHDLVLDGLFWIGDFNLRHLVDTAKLLGRQRPVDWRFLDEVCSSPFIRKQLAIQLKSAHELAGSQAPPAHFRSLLANAHYLRMRLQHDIPQVKPFLVWLGHLVNWRNLSVRTRVGAPRATLPVS